MKKETDPKNQKSWKVSYVSEKRVRKIDHEVYKASEKNRIKAGLDRVPPPDREMLEKNTSN